MIFNIDSYNKILKQIRAKMIALLRHKTLQCRKKRRQKPKPLYHLLSKEVTWL